MWRGLGQQSTEPTGNEMCCAGLAQFEENKEFDRGVFRVVATAYAIVLCRRNQHMFADQGAVLWSLLINIDAKSYVTRSCRTNLSQTYGQIASFKRGVHPGTRIEIGQ